MSKNEIDIAVDFFGLRTLESTLRRIDPELSKQLVKTARAPMDDVRNRARRLVTVANKDIPSGWKKPGGGERGWGDSKQRRWQSSKVKDGIKIKKNMRTRGGVTNYFTLLNTSPAGNIYEFAKNPQTPQGRSFVRALDNVPTSRLIWRAWDQAGGEAVVRPAVVEAIEAVAKEFEQRMKNVPKEDRIGFR